MTQDVIPTEIAKIQMIQNILGAAIIGPVFISTGLAFKDISRGIANAAEIRLMMLITFIPLVFATVTIVFAILSGMAIQMRAYDDVTLAYTAIAGTIISAAGMSLTPYGIGKATLYAAATVAQNKKFKSHFIILCCFCEALTIFATVFGLMFFPSSNMSK